MSPEAWTAVGVIGAAALGAGGFLQSYLKNRPARKKPWEVAVDTLKDQVAALRTEVQDARAEVAAAQHKLDSVLSEKRELEATVEKQSRALLAHAARIAQLLTAWPRDSGRPPKPDPAHAPYL